MTPYFRSKPKPSDSALPSLNGLVGSAAWSKSALTVVYGSISSLRGCGMSRRPATWPKWEAYPRSVFLTHCQVVTSFVRKISRLKLKPHS